MTRYGYEKVEEYPRCMLCNEMVVKHVENYETFEKMHWICFHIKHEHSGDPDSACGDPSCPNARLQAYENGVMKMRDELGYLWPKPWEPYEWNK